MFITAAIDGFVCLGAITVTGGLYSSESVPVVIGLVGCAGNESSLIECSYVTESHEEIHDCDPRESAAVVCQG